jgi:hypothetical protein
LLKIAIIDVYTALRRAAACEPDLSNDYWATSV